MIDPQLVALRRTYRRPGYSTLADVGLDGEYVSPSQITSHSPAGPVLLAYNWLDASSALKHRAALSQCGYLQGMIFNKVVDAALRECGIPRADIYITQAFHLLPAARSGDIPIEDVDDCFAAITRRELLGRKVIALGTKATGACRRGCV